VIWEKIIYILGLDETDLEAIKRSHIKNYDLQKFNMLQRWKNKKKNTDSTYRVLHDCFITNDMYSLAEDLVEIMRQEVPVVVSKVMKKYQEKLKNEYKVLPVIDSDNWPPRPSEAYINLALINQRRVKIGKIDNDYIINTIHHCTDDILNEKEPIELLDVFKFEEEEKKKCVLIEAGPGLGKTMLAVKICKDWANGHLLQDYDAVVLLLLRHCELQKAKTITDLFPLEDKDFKKELVKEIHENKGSRVCFIVEGFDELPLKLQKESIFINLVKKLSNSLVVYTSRPVGTEKLRKQVVCKRIEIIGFKPEQIQEYIETTLIELTKQDHSNEHAGKKKASNLLELIKSNILVGRLVHIPIYLAIITHIFYQRQSLPSSRTELYRSLLLSIFLRYLREKKQDGTESLESFDELSNVETRYFYNICNLAFQGLQKSKVTFNTRDIQLCKIPADIDGLGLLNAAPSLLEYGTSKNFHFFHLTLQEFCAAFHILKLSKPDKFDVFIEQRDNPKFQIVWQFFAGLSKLNTKRILTSMIPVLDMFSVLQKADLMQLLLCLYEVNIPDLCEKVIKFMNGIIDLSYYEMDLLQCSALAYCIANCPPGSFKLLNLGWCGIGDKGLQAVSKALTWPFQSDPCGVNVQLLEPLDLDVSYNDLTGSGAHYIAELLSSPCLVGRLACTGNHKLGDYGIETIVKSTINNYTIQTLELRGCDIGIKGMQAICESLKNVSDLKTLDISETILNHELLKLLCESLNHNCTLTTLQLKWCKLGTDLSTIADGLFLNNSLLNLDLQHNDLGNRGVDNIVRALKCNSKLNSLNLDVNGITDDGVPFIGELITADLSNLSELYISGNFQEHGIEVVCNALTKNSSLHTLGLMPCKMSLEEQSSVALSKLLTSTAIKSLHIVPPDNCSALSTAIASNTTLEELKVCVKLHNHFSTILDGIKKNVSISKLEFLLTVMDRRWLKDLAGMLHSKINLISLIINGEVYAEECMILCPALLKCKALQRLTLTPYQKIIPPTALKFVTALHTLESLEYLKLLVDIHQTQGKGLDNHSEFSTPSKVKFLPKVPKEHVTNFRKLEDLVCSINERRRSAGIAELYLHIVDK